LKIVEVNVRAVIASFSTNVAVPNDAGLGPPVLVVGTVGGTSWEFVRFAKKMVSAYAPGPDSKTAIERKTIMSRSINPPLLQALNGRIANGA